jgi:ABC-2 type transport system ATP-binding protein
VRGQERDGHAECDPRLVCGRVPPGGYEVEGDRRPQRGSGRLGDRPQRNARGGGGHEHAEWRRAARDEGERRRRGQRHARRVEAGVPAVGATGGQQPERAGEHRDREGDVAEKTGAGRRSQQVRHSGHPGDRSPRSSPPNRPAEGSSRPSWEGSRIAPRRVSRRVLATYGAGMTLDRTPAGPAAGSSPVIETRALTKRYGERIVAVDALDLRVRRGEVYGFLGPNGAGKTTTLRMLLGLVRPTAGEALVLGAPPGAAEALARIGAMVEAPAFYPYLSGRDNLRVLARHAAAHEDRIDDVLTEVDLLDRARDRFATYSLGMKQRLGVAAALLKQPELLILDEPSNGLDPAGMAEMRQLVRSLGQGGRTVVLSSHLMTEVEQIADRVGVIRDGALVAEGTVDELRGGTRLRVQAEPLAAAATLIEGLPDVRRVAGVDGRLDVTVDPGEAAAINRALVHAGIAVSELTVQRASLEDVFLELTATTEERS